MINCYACQTDKICDRIHYSEDLSKLIYQFILQYDKIVYSIYKILYCVYEWKA